jgi:hypothetical protein
MALALDGVLYLRFCEDFTYLALYFPYVAFILVDWLIFAID